MARKPWESAVDVFIHVIVGTFCFLVIVGLAVGLNLLVHLLEGWGVSNFVILVIQGGEYALLGADILLFIVFLVKTTWRATQDL